MNAEVYTPGHSENAVDFMSKRTLESHGAFFMPLLEPGLSVLDCGCGPGTMTLEIAQRVAPGRVVGVDFGRSQIEQANRNAAQFTAQAQAAQAHRVNILFQQANCYDLPFADNMFDRVFSHALLEHLAEPVRALREFFRVLKPGGQVGICSPDWGGFLLAPPSADLSQAIDTYMTLQNQNGGDVQVGRKLGAYLAAAGFQAVQMSARYECYADRTVIGEYLALQLDQAGATEAAKTLRAWSTGAGSMFAQSWVAAVGQKPASLNRD